MRYIISDGQSARGKSILWTTLTSGKDAAVCCWGCICCPATFVARTREIPI